MSTLRIIPVLAGRPALANRDGPGLYRQKKKALESSVDPDETPHDAPSHQGLRCLLKGISLIWWRTRLEVWVLVPYRLLNFLPPGYTGAQRGTVGVAFLID
ncbi:hypothetical protein DPMN_026547 [Dreissena polymorpha]|uniref:Uncharacterized protein n=1 Tax=Dreissena polymorpha TaxID=45954 RepID=A0A9D4LRV0_DREPO|nr:hypothetical protein DPMN_026547 [Dreissena polymorpha]